MKFCQNLMTISRRPNGRSALRLLTAVAVAGASATTAHAGTLYAAGLDQYGQLGNNTAGTPAVPAAGSASTPAPVIGLGLGVTAAAGGGAHSLAVMNGALYGWGLNTYGAPGTGVGDGNGAAPQSNNTAQPGVALTSGVTDVRAGLYHSMALANGGVYTFGLNTDGQLANGTVANGYTSTPLIVPSLSSGVTAIATGKQHALAVQNGALYAWGNTFYGQVGTGLKATSPLAADRPANVTMPTLVPGLVSGVTMVSAGSLHSLAVMNNAVYAFGSNQFGQLGNNGTTGTDTFDALYPTAQAVVGLPAGTVTDISGGNEYSLALVNGGVYAWGRNSSGQLGQGNFSNSPVPLQVSGLGNLITHVEAGSTTAYALSADGTLWTWGGNTYGQAAVGSTDEPLLPTPQHVFAPAGYTITDIRSGPNSSDALITLSLVGDFNRDDLVNAADIDLLLRAPQGPLTVANARYDVTGDVNVTPKPGAAGSDADYWVHTIKHTAYGDTNLDGHVNFDDLVTLAQNYNGTGKTWAFGDFNGDSLVNFDDLVPVAQNYNFGAGSGLTASAFAADWALAQSLAPEPTSFMAVAGAAGMMLRRRRVLKSVS